MGTKFGNIHVKTDQLNDVISALDAILEQTIKPASQFENTGFDSLMEQAYLSRNIYYLGQLKPGWVTILNDWFGWGEVESFGEELSSHIGYPILTISYFDDDLFEMNVFSSGSNLTGQIWCSEETREVYELEEKQADISIMSELLGHEHISKINEILEIDDCEKAVEELQKIIDMPLWVHSDWFNDIDDEDFKSQYIKHDFNK